MEDKHIVIKKYLQEHSLVESNITSFNNLIEKRMQEIVDEISESLSDEEPVIKLGKIRVGNPNVVEADGSEKLVTPTEARIRGMTYAAPIFLEISIKQEGRYENEEVEIGSIPIIVKSNVCNTTDMSDEELIENGIDKIDPGGYFIINGNERIIIMAEDLAENQPFIDEKLGKLVLRLFSKKGAYRVPVTISEKNNGLINVSFSRFKDIPITIMLKALGMTKDSDIAGTIGKETDSLVVNLYEFVDINTQEQAMMEIAERSGLKGTKEEKIERVKQRIDSYFMPHIGIDKKARFEKAVTLCKLIKEFLIGKEKGVFTDKDHYANKRVRLSGDLLADLFRVNLKIFVRDIQYSLQKTLKRRKFYSLRTIAKSTLFSRRIESAIATGNWIGNRTGVTQNMDKTNYLAILSQLQRVSSVLPGKQANFLARTLHPTHYGRFCPIETPEGTQIGLRKNLALMAKVSTDIELNEGEFLKKLEELGMKGICSENSGEMTDIFFNGRFVGEINKENAEQFIKELRGLRRQGKLPQELGMRYDREYQKITISSEAGRVLRPLIIVENGKSLLKEEHKELLKQDKIKWDDLLSQGIVEYIDAGEEENALVALNKEDITEEHTHLEIDHIDLFGIVTSLVPYGNHDQSSRLNRGSKTQKQALGIYSTNFPIRLDTDVSILHYPQKPIVRSFVYDTLNVHPSGQNLIVAIMPYEGYNMEDAIVVNRGSVQRGMGRSTYFRPYTSKEIHYAGGLSDEITIPGKDTSGYKTEESYRYLEDDGIVYPEARLKEGEVVIGKLSPPKFLSEARDITLKAKKEASSVIRHEEKGTIDKVFISIDNEGNKIIHVRTRDQRELELGDKLSTSHGQKGVIGRVVDENDIPFTSSGIKPDLLFNPHGIPSRMTIGYLLELLAGKVGSISGRIMDGTSFSSDSQKKLESMLKKLGFRPDGKEAMYDPITGKILEAKIFIGNMYYLKLKYMASNKLHARASGKVTLLTRQPIEGRAKGGALRLGEMEQQALVAHGASLLLKERYDSDKIILPICTECGAIAIEDKIRDKTECPICSSEEIQYVEVSYAFKLLLEELQSLHILTKFDLKNKYE